MSKYLNSISNPRDKAINVLFIKTGIRRENLRNIDCDDINWYENKITIKVRKSKKRTFPYVFFDDECKQVLKYWEKRRKMLAVPCEKERYPTTLNTANPAKNAVPASASATINALFVRSDFFFKKLAYVIIIP